MSSADFRKKYIKYKNKYLDIKRLVGGKYSNDDSVPIIELYEYNLSGYKYIDNGHKNARYTFGDIMKSDCGIVSIDGSVKSEGKKSSDDIINSFGKRVVYGGAMNADEIKKFMNDMINIYVKYSTRLDRLNDNLPKTICSYIEAFRGMCNDIESEYQTIFQPPTKSEFGEFCVDGDTIDNNAENLCAYAQKIDAASGDKIVIMGDIHGSFHTFIRLLYRYHLYGILDLKTMKIADGYKIIFLGDVVDRGNYSMEITFIIFLLICVNNIQTSTESQNRKIYYNRGNHEEYSQSFTDGFRSEIKKKCGDETFHKEIMYTLAHFPSALRLECGDRNKKINIWLAHGGFPWIASPMKWDNNRCMLTYKQGLDTRWSDFVYDDDAEPIVSGRGVGYKYNDKHVKEFMERENIKFIIRGHQDNYNNSYLFSNQKKEKHDGYDISLENKESNDVLYYNNSTENYASGPIARILCDGDVFDTPEQKNNEPKLYPVLTISTNTDLDRTLSSDSFALLRFDIKKNNIAKFENILTAINESPNFE